MIIMTKQVNEAILLKGTDMKIASGVEMLDITANMLGRVSVIHPTVVWDPDTVVLVDAGFPGQVEAIRAAVREAGVTFERLEWLILTHQDIDHIGSAGSIRQALDGRVNILAYEEEKAYIEGEKRPLKLAQMEANLDALPEDMKTVYQRLNAGFQASHVKVDQTLADGEVLPFGGGMTVIATPGHTLGHISLYLPASKTLIAGDALSVQEGRLALAPAQTNYDLDMCRKSLAKLREYDIETVICYHGGLYNDEPNRYIAGLV